MKLKVPKTERKRSSDSRFKRFLKNFVLVLIVVVLVLAAYIFPLMARYSNTLRQHATNALILAVVKLPRTVGLVLLSALPLLILALSIQTFLNTLVFWLAIGFGFTGYMSSTLLRPVFRELENQGGPGVQVMTYNQMRLTARSAAIFIW